MSFDLTGKVIEVSPIQQVSDKFRKREFIIEVAEQSSGGREFIEYIKFQCVQERCDLINEDFINNHIRISFNIKGNKWEKDGKVNYFTNLDAWKIDKIEPGAAPADDFAPPPPLDDLPPENEEFEDLPF